METLGVRISLKSITYLIGNLAIHCPKDETFSATTQRVKDKALPFASAALEVTYDLCVTIAAMDLRVYKALKSDNIGGGDGKGNRSTSSIPMTRI
jgi:hypothetical protein